MSTNTEPMSVKEALALGAAALGYVVTHQRAGQQSEWARAEHTLRQLLRQARGPLPERGDVTVLRSNLNTEARL